MSTLRNELPLEVSELEIVERSEPTKLGGRPRNRNNTLDRKTGKYDYPEALLERMGSFLSDPDNLSLLDEIAASRAIFQHQLEAWKDWEQRAKVALGTDDEIPSPPVSVKDLVYVIDHIGKMVERQHRMTYADVNLITVESAVVFVLALADIVNRYVKSVDERSAVLAALRTLLLKGRSFELDAVVAKRLLAQVKDVE